MLAGTGAVGGSCRRGCRSGCQGAVPGASQREAALSVAEIPIRKDESPDSSSRNIVTPTHRRRERSTPSSDRSRYTPSGSGQAFRQRTAYESMRGTARGTIASMKRQHSGIHGTIPTVLQFVGSILVTVACQPGSTPTEV